MMPGNPYHGIFVLDEKIANAGTEDELYEIRGRIKKNRKYSLDTKRMIYTWIYHAIQALRGLDPAEEDARYYRKYLQSSEKREAE